MPKKIKVLILDDSLLFRESLDRGISSDPMIEVVAKAVDPFDARDKLIAFEPDVMTCDVELPKMNGIEFIRRLLPQYPIPIIVVSALSGVVLGALKVGAVEFVAKPDPSSKQSQDEFMRDLIDKIKIAAKARIVEPISNRGEVIATKNPIDSNKVIAIGASTGGTEAIFHILKNMKPPCPPILITQHIPQHFSRMFAERLNNQTAFTVKEASNGDDLELGKVLIAPGNMHMALKKIGSLYKVDVFEGEKVNGHCPSVDVLFDSVAQACGRNAIGVILTGMGYDGAKGLLAMRRKGARTIGQNEASCVVYGMPKVAYDVGAVELQASLENIPSMLYGMVKKNG